MPFVFDSFYQKIHLQHLLPNHVINDTKYTNYILRKSDGNHENTFNSTIILHLINNN